MADTTPPTGPNGPPPDGADELHAARDEAVSAYLDGEATPDEIAMVEASSELLGRVEVFRSLQAPMRAVPSADPAHQNLAVAAAIAAVTIEPAEVAAAAEAVIKARSQARRRPWMQRFAPGLVLACLLLGGLIAAPFLFDGNDNAPTESADLATAATDGQGSGANAAQAPSESTPTDASGFAATEADGLTGNRIALDALDEYAPQGKLDGAFADVNELLSTVENDLGRSAEGAPTAQSPATTFAPAPAGTGEAVSADEANVTLRFRTEACSDIDIGVAVVLEAILAPHQAVFVVLDGPEAAIVIVDATTCEVLGRR